MKTLTPANTTALNEASEQTGQNENVYRDEDKYGTPVPKQPTEQLP